MTCVQCGHPHPHRIGRRRYSCRACGAVFRRGAPRDPFASTEGDPLAAYMPARMVRWVRAQGEASPTPDRVAMARWYKGFDAFVARARADAAERADFERLSEVPLEDLPAKPPAFPQVCAALHASCYSSELAEAKVGHAERVGHARAWLAAAGRSTTWLEARPAADPPHDAVKELLPLPSSFSAAQVSTLFSALFQVERGPSLPGVLALGVEPISLALAAYLETGERPLLDTVRASL